MTPAEIRELANIHRDDTDSGGTTAALLDALAGLAEEMRGIVERCEAWIELDAKYKPYGYGNPSITSAAVAEVARYRAALAKVEAV